MAGELGFKIPYNTALEEFAGASMIENLRFISDHIEGELPVDFEKEFRKRTFERFKSDLHAIPGIHQLLDKVQVPYCVASSGPQEKIKLNLTVNGLMNYFEGRIFSCYDINSWKPEPDIYWHAAKTMGYAPDECLVIEDSSSGIKAAVAGGFRVFALASEKKKDAFEKLGATVFYSMEELAVILNLD
jgi:HAD superfamily hydrolase (TIGR01509 family)